MSDASSVSPCPTPTISGLMRRTATDPAGLVGAEHDERVRAPRLRHGLFHRDGKIAAICVLDQMRQHLGVGVGLKPVPARHQVVFQREKVFDDPVVNHDDAAAAVHVRVRILVGRLPVGRPPGVPDPHVPVHRLPLHKLREPGELARRLAHPRIPLLLFMTATPAESYPRYSRRRRPSSKIGTAGRSPI